MLEEMNVNESVDNGVDNGDNNQPEPFGGPDPQETTEEFDVSPFLKHINDSGMVKFNQEPQTIADLESLINGYQKGLNYDKVYGERNEYKQQLEQAQNNPQLAFLNEMAAKYGFEGKVDEWATKVREQWENDALRELVDKNIPEDIAKELMENRKFREQYGEKEKLQSQEAETNKMFQDFITQFPDVNSEDIPQDVWNMVEEGRDLTAAYAIHLAKNINGVKAEAQQETLKALSENADSSTGSVNDNTSADNQNTISVDEVNRLMENMSSAERTAYVKKNYDMLEKAGYFSKLTL